MPGRAALTLPGLDPADERAPWAALGLPADVRLAADEDEELDDDEEDDDLDDDDEEEEEEEDDEA